MKISAGAAERSLLVRVTMLARSPSNPSPERRIATSSSAVGKKGVASSPSTSILPIPSPFSPAVTPAAVLRLPPRPSHGDLLTLVQTLANALEHERIEGKLWIVEAGRIRIYQEQPSD